MTHPEKQICVFMFHVCCRLQIRHIYLSNMPLSSLQGEGEDTQWRREEEEEEEDEDEEREEWGGERRRGAAQEAKNTRGEMK